MPLIPFPDVPDYPGVPQLLRPANAAIASVPVLSIAIGSLENILISALQQQSQWGIFDADGNQIGVTDPDNSIVTAFTSQLTGARQTVLSTVTFDFTRETKVSDFPIAQGSFASYNKVQTPATPSVTLALAGSESDRANFLNALEVACISTDLYSVVTPEIQYVNYSIERYTYSRKADKGVTLLMVEISLKEIRQVSAAYTVTVNPPITNPQDASATSQTNNGLTQTTTPDNSTALNIANNARTFFSGLFQ
jgi:hypothetical protein